jgi:hypothetical protein
MSGAVTITVQGAQPVALRRGASLPSGGILTTGPTGRALLVRAEETMIVGPNAAIAIPQGSNNRQFTTILANSGVVEFSVDRKNVQHFAVETPYLAALVKGTQFSVEVTRTGATVQVTSGTVEVTAHATGQFASLTAGQVATVDSNGVFAIGGLLPRPTVFQGIRRGPVVGATFASLSVGAAVDFGSIGSVVGYGLGPAAGGGSAALGPSVNTITAGPDGVDVATGLATVSAGSGGVQVEAAGLASVSVGSDGVQVEGPAGLGLGTGRLQLGLGN